MPLNSNHAAYGINSFPHVNDWVSSGPFCAFLGETLFGEMVQGPVSRHCSFLVPVYFVFFLSCLVGVELVYNVCYSESGVKQDAQLLPFACEDPNRFPDGIL